MSTGPEKKPPSKTVQFCSLIFLMVGIVGFQAMKPLYFPRKPGDGFNVSEMVAAGVVGGVFGGLGACLGMLLDRARKK
jgi:hypothetical protein